MCANFSKVSEVVRELFEIAVVVRELFGIILTSVIRKVGWLRYFRSQVRIHAFKLSTRVTNSFIKVVVIYQRA